MQSFNGTNRCARKSQTKMQKKEVVEENVAVEAVVFQKDKDVRKVANGARDAAVRNQNHKLLAKIIVALIVTKMANFVEKGVDVSWFLTLTERSSVTVLDLQAIIINVVVQKVI